MQHKSIGRQKSHNWTTLSVITGSIESSQSIVLRIKEGLIHLAYAHIPIHLSASTSYPSRRSALPLMSSTAVHTPDCTKTALLSSPCEFNKKRNTPSAPKRCPLGTCGRREEGKPAGARKGLKSCCWCCCMVTCPSLPGAFLDFLWTAVRWNPDKLLF